MTMRGAVSSLQSERAVQSSWERCRSQHVLSPNQWRSPRFVGLAELERRRKQAGFAYQVASAELASLEQVLHGPIGVALTDQEAVILGYAGDPPFTKTARQFGLRPGAVWSESEQGTNGMGTCLAECAPVVIERQQHFLRQNTALSCYAVPILDGTGRLVGVLNASSAGPLSSAPIIALLEMVVQNIERRTLLEGFCEHFVLRLHDRREYLSTGAEAILVIDKTGKVVGVNRAALRLFDVVSHASLCSQSATELLGVTPAALQRIAAGPGDPQLLAHAPYFAQVSAPLTARLSPSGEQAAADATDDASAALGRAERATLLAILKRNQGNVTRSAEALGISRRTLHRKLREHHLERVEFPASEPV
jgi:transcriptional regulator of acetoin/glycerol metabolism